MKRGMVAVLVVLGVFAAALPAAARTVKGSVGPGGERFWGFVPPIGGAQAVVTVSWKQKGSTALVVLGCDDGAGGALIFGGSANLNLDRTARVEGGVLGSACVVGVGAFGGKVSFTMNVDAEADSTSTIALRDDGSTPARHLVPLSRADVPAAIVEALGRLAAAPR